MTIFKAREPPPHILKEGYYRKQPIENEIKCDKTLQGKTTVAIIRKINKCIKILSLARQTIFSKDLL